MGKKKTLEEFGKDLFNKWGKHITLCEESVYTNNKTKIIVKCDKHGKISQTPDNLLKHDCKLCSIEKNSKKCTKGKENFVIESNVIHNNKYSYDKFKYVNNKTKGIITCPIHGDFEQTPSKHLQGHGCRKCANEIISNSRKQTYEEFVLKANKIHNNKYMYIKETYLDSMNKMDIVCKSHGIFKQTPAVHLTGVGCPICCESKLEKDVRKLLEENNINFIQKATKSVIPWVGRQHLDFYLPDHNIAIECQGVQHFEPREKFGGEKEFVKTVKRDKLKEDKCIKNGVKLLLYSNKKYCSSIIDDLTILKNNIIKY
jgi:hypothetical protein